MAARAAIPSAHWPATSIPGSEDSKKQRVAIARALAGNPAVILADEPTGNLDQATGREIIGLLRRLNETESATLVVITHDTHVAAATQRQIELRDGRIVAESGTPAPGRTE
jgi:putative ABC transport system ATP-binding protein